MSEKELRPRLESMRLGKGFRAFFGRSKWSKHKQTIGPPPTEGRDAETWETAQCYELLSRVNMQARNLPLASLAVLATLTTLAKLTNLAQSPQSPPITTTTNHHQSPPITTNHNQ